MDLHRIMSMLSEERPVFRSKEDLENALHDLLSRWFARTYKEYRHPGLARKDFDIFLELPDERIAIELFYKQKKLSVEWGGEVFELRDHAANDQGRYEVLSDLQYLEQSVRSGACTRGAVILLTNDRLYWNPPAVSRPTVDRAFRFHEGAVLAGELAWSDDASPGTVSGMERPIVLAGTYRAQWRDYSFFPEKDTGLFRYLLFDVK